MALSRAAATAALLVCAGVGSARGGGLVDLVDTRIGSGGVGFGVGSVPPGPQVRRGQAAGRACSCSCGRLVGAVWCHAAESRHIVGLCVAAVQPLWWLLLQWHVVALPHAPPAAAGRVMPLVMSRRHAHPGLLSAALRGQRCQWVGKFGGDGHPWYVRACLSRSVYRPACLPTCLSVWLPAFGLFVCLPVCRPACLPPCLFEYLLLSCMSACLSVGVCVRDSAMCVCLWACVSVPSPSPSGSVYVPPRGGAGITSTLVVPNAFNYRSTFSHDSEVAVPGYYAVHLDTPGALAELTAAGALSGLHRYARPTRDLHSRIDGRMGNNCVRAWGVRRGI